MSAISANQIAEHKRVFYEQLGVRLAAKDHTAYPTTLEVYDKKVECLRLIKNGTSASQLVQRGDFPSVYTWVGRYQLVEVANNEMLVYRAEPNPETNEATPLDQLKKVAHRENCFDCIRELHIFNQLHIKGDKLRDKVKERYGKSIPGDVCKLFTDTCPICISKATRKKPKAGHQPIITPGFNHRCQFDLIDMQAMPDGEMKFILNYVECSTKWTQAENMRNKEAPTVAWNLYKIMCTGFGPPPILQCDNAREFNGLAHNGRDNSVELDDEVSQLDTFKLFGFLWLANMACFLAPFFAVLCRCRQRDQEALAKCKIGSRQTSCLRN